MRRLADHVKRRIIEHLACYCTHVEVVKLIFEEYGLKVTPRQVRSYDPMSFQFAASTRWREVHALARKRFEQEVAEVPISHRAFRLRRLHQIHEAAMEADNWTVATEALEQAAKEVGNMFVNARVAAMATKRG